MTRHIPICDVTHSYVRHDSFVCATLLIPTCGIPLSYVQEFIFPQNFLIDTAGVWNNTNKSLAEFQAFKPSSLPPVSTARVRVHVGGERGR